MNVEIWHNPRCSKSRQTLQLLTDRGVEASQVRYLEAPPSRERLQQVADLLGGARALIRDKEAAYSERGLSSDSTDEQLLDAMATEPRLIERPVVITPNGAAIGRPPEAVLAVL